ncbi:MAG: radical SAM protein [Planctomycetota bacterium]|nr:radical SAM protein [Planctomycetota bacterium]
MKVLLIRPPVYRHVTAQSRSYAPVGLATVAAGLRDAGHEVAILDAEIGERNDPVGGGVFRRGMPDEEIRARVTEFAPDAVGLSCMFAVSMPAIVDLAALVRPLFEGPMVAGGYAATSDPEYLFENTPIDSVILGEGELAFAKYLEAWPQVERIVPQTWEPDLDSYPRPAYDLIDFELYREFETTFVGLPQEALNVRSVGVQSSRGCPVGCNFCSVQLISGTPLRRRDPKKFVDELIRLRDELGIRKVHFFDDNLTLNRSHALAVFLEMAARCPMPWVATQGTGVWNWDAELLDAAKASGMLYLSLPIESGSEYVLHEIMHKKPLKLGHVKDVVRMCREKEIPTFAWVIIGSPGETKADMEMGLYLLNQLDVDYRIASVVTPYPGSELFDECVEKGYIETPLRFELLRMAQGMITTPEFSAGYTTARVAAWTLRGRLKVGQGVATVLRKCFRAHGLTTTLRAIGLAVLEWWRYGVRGIDPLAVDPPQRKGAQRPSSAAPSPMQ